MASISIRYSDPHCILSADCKKFYWIGPRSYVLVVIDGTWREAKKMYQRSPALQNLAAIHLDLTAIERKSEYVVRTQPTDQCLSTVEIVAHTVEILESDSTVVDKLVAPLRALCRSEQ